MNDDQVNKKQSALTKVREVAGYERVAVSALSFITFGAVFYHYVERLNWLDSFYFTTMTLATVGYGDIAPKTAAGKVFTMFYVLVGITIFIALARIVLSRLVIRANVRRNKD